MAQVNMNGNGGFRSATPNSRYVYIWRGGRMLGSGNGEMDMRSYFAKEGEKVLSREQWGGFYGGLKGVQRADELCGWGDLGANTATPSSRNLRTRMISNWRV